MKRSATQPAKAGKPAPTKTAAKRVTVKTAPQPAKARAATSPARPASKTVASKTVASKTVASKTVASKSVAAKGPPSKAHRSLCPINLVLEAVGDNWSLLILRDLMFRGHSSYQAFLRSEEGIATNILADRLQRLEQNGLISKAQDPADARKFIYALTGKGADMAPILVEMTLFANRHTPRVDMPKDVLADMMRNKTAFAARMIRSCSPKARGRAAKAEAAESRDETLSLF